MQRQKTYKNIKDIQLKLGALTADYIYIMNKVEENCMQFQPPCFENKMNLFQQSIYRQKKNIVSYQNLETLIYSLGQLKNYIIYFLHLKRIFHM